MKNTQNTINIHLKDQTLVKVNRFELGYTYSSLLEGSPNEEINKDIYDWITYPPNWGKRTYLKEKPSFKAFKDRLPECYFSVWLSSYETQDPYYHGTELVYTWFADLPTDKSIVSILQAGIEELDWKKHATGFEF